MPMSRIYNVNLLRQHSNFNLHKNSLQNDKAVIDKVIEETDGIYDKLKENNNSINNHMIIELQRKNIELQRENEILNEEINELLTKNNELREFLKQRLN
jgi:alanyl-tRNA synthetase